MISFPLPINGETTIWHAAMITNWDLIAQAVALKASELESPSKWGWNPNNSCCVGPISSFCWSYALRRVYHIWIGGGIIYYISSHVSPAVSPIPATLVTQVALTGQGPQHPNRGLEGCHLGSWEWQARKEWDRLLQWSPSYGRGWFGTIWKSHDISIWWHHLYVAAPFFLLPSLCISTIYLGWFRSSRWCQYIPWVCWWWHMITYHMVSQIIWI